MPDSDSGLIQAALRHVLAVLAHSLGSVEVDLELVDALFAGRFVAVGRKRGSDLLIVGGALVEPDPGRQLVRPLSSDAAGPVRQNTIRLLVERYVRQVMHGKCIEHERPQNRHPALAWN